MLLLLNSRTGPGRLEPTTKVNKEDGTVTSQVPKHHLSLHHLLDLGLRTFRGQGTTKVEAAMDGRISSTEEAASTGRGEDTTTTSCLSPW
jgi:hypothetical protein